MTRPCPTCGAANADDEDFCGSCGTYLGWSTRVRPGGPHPDPAEPDAPPAPDPDPVAPPAPEPERRTAPGPAAPAPDPAPEPERRTPPSPAAPPARDPDPAPVPEPRATRRSAWRRSPEPEPAATPDPAPRPAAPAAPPTPEPVPALEPRTAPAPPPAAPRPPAPAPVQPARPKPPEPVPGPAEEPIGAVLPGVPIAARPTVRTAAADDEPDGEPCPSCGTNNRPGRTFCRNCAEPLKPRAQAAPLPWWRTRWPFNRRVRAGSGRLLRGSLIALVIAGLLVAGFLLIPAGRYVVEDVRDKLGGTGEVSPLKVTANEAAPGHPAKAAVDGVTNTYWGAPKTGDALTAEFEDPFRLVGVTVHTGVSTKAEVFQKGARPTRADLLITTKDGKQHEKTMTLADKPGEQTLRMGISDVVSVRFTVREAAGQGGGHPIALGEIEYFKRT
ncbi:NADase-type glycan-binding domain-containing protein [Streptomyces sp. DT224]|uniref:NADase-type glycan-binding domain-containing protein n=1 Tax=Streptomyces sp. DT224 TaxID=3393426 RepID=UPI003CE864FF